MKSAFDEHISMFGLSFPTADEYAFRLDQFMRTDEFITKENKNPANTFTLGHNKFSTWT